MPLRISRRSQLKFAEYASAFSTLNEIDRCFESEGFELNPNQEYAGGQRRTRCASYHSLIDPQSFTQQRRLLDVYLDAIDSWGARQDAGSLAKPALVTGVTCEELHVAQAEERSSGPAERPAQRGQSAAAWVACTCARDRRVPR